MGPERRRERLSYFKFMKLGLAVFTLFTCIPHVKEVLAPPGVIDLSVPFRVLPSESMALSRTKVLPFRCESESLQAGE